ncbi:DNA-binding transcriptional activator of the SARP family [Amycolatopsis arida]|uniref:DNA-binding transcriptional activator of the SARP family n=1 Tax=Amycolatopsis arida TaxID=587909 RepID=A0A1I5LPS7_9PSEU|nr:BTAD domain-containing putative transcriptional regulator [Amycolatopsis arida]TDX93793.1 DNA-binding SARP family transcriptional activator [Amycolatopsis arida]SFO99163.1 DNA-binding transcriptional activator of the SARP family [Amycolatopsis arida]
MTAISFRVLGPLEVEVAGRPVPLGGPKPRLLLATLLLHANVAVSTDLLIDVLWPGTAPRSAPANIRTYVHSLRRRLVEGGAELADRIRNRPSGYLLEVGPGELDLAVFEDQVAGAQEALARRDVPAALRALDEAGRLWRGHVLEDLPHSHRWSATVARLAELRLTAHEQRLRLRVESGEHHDAVVELRGLLAEHPLREELWQQLIRALADAGRTAEALQAYAEVEQILLTELDAEPGPGLRALRTRLLGGPGDRPASPFPVCQLPLDLPDFTGREGLVTELVGALRARETPAVVVLSGPPGAGKSAVAVRVAHAVRADFPDGQLHVDLAGTSGTPRTPEQVLPELLRAVGVTDGAMPRGLAERAALLRSRLARRRVCVVLDDAAGAAQVRPLLPGTGGCAVLVTSRVRMPDLTGAHPVDVDVLPEPDAARLLAGIVGERRVRAEPDGAAAILRYCGHLPLAIRIAGAKLAGRPGWTLRTLADRLRDERRRLDELRVGDLAVRASLALSYDQLPERAAAAFRWLGLLGPLRLPGWVVAALLDARDPADDVLDTLVDAHLVELTGCDVAGEPRYRLHDLLRCFAAGRAGEDGAAVCRAAVRRVLAEYVARAVDAAARMPIHFLGVTAGAGDPRRPIGVDPVAWYAAEHRAAVALVELAARWELDDAAWRLAAAFAPYFDLRGHQDDWQRTHEVALAAARRAEDRYGQAVMLRNLGQVRLYQDAYVEATDAFAESHRLFDEAGDGRGAAIALAGLGTVLRVRGELDEAFVRCLESLAQFGAVGDQHGEAVARLAVGSVWLARGCHSAARRWFTDARELAGRIGDRHREAHALKRLAELHQHRGNLALAREHIDEAIAIFTGLGDDHCVGYANQSLGMLCLDSGDLAHARLLLVNSLSVHRRNGDRRSEAEVAELLGRLHETIGQPQRSQRYRAHARSLWRDLGVAAPGHPGGAEHAARPGPTADPNVLRPA